MHIVHIDKRRYDIQEQKKNRVWYTGVYQPISSSGYNTTTSALVLFKVVRWQHCSARSCHPTLFVDLRESGRK